MVASLSPQQLPNNVLISGLTLLAPNTNSGTIYVGTSSVSSATGFPLVAGSMLQMAITNANQIWMIGTNTSDKLAGIGV